MHEGEIWIAGVDGCRGGWMVVMHPLDRPSDARVDILPSFAHVLTMSEQPCIIAIDIPIGLPDRTGPGGRICDALARKTVGPRFRSVFSVPARIAFSQPDILRARALALRFSDPPRSITAQLWNVRKSILDVDGLMTPALQIQIHECHPEFIFYRLNGNKPLALPKKKAAGREFRWTLLNKQRGYCLDVFEVLKRSQGLAKPDDVVDACAAAACAADIVRGVAIRVPDDPPRDAKGLRMEIWG